MKSIETMLAETREAVFAAELKKGFSEAATQTAWNDRMQKCSSVEQKLSVAKKYLASFGESRPRITRNNGSGSFQESDKSVERIQKHIQQTGKSWKEASIFMTGKVVPEPGNASDELRESWRRYCPALKSHELDTLVARKVPVPTR
jgi:hypothetical protein